MSHISYVSSRFVNRRTRNFGATSNLKCDQKGLATFLGLDSTEIESKDDPILGSGWGGFTLDKQNALAKSAYCSKQTGRMSMYYYEPYTKSMLELPGAICSVKKECELMWAPVYRAKQSYLMATDPVLGGLSDRQAWQEARTYFRQTYLPTFVAYLNEILNRDAVKNSIYPKTIMNAYLTAVTAPDYMDKVFKSAAEQIEYQKQQTAQR